MKYLHWYIGGFITFVSLILMIFNVDLNISIPLIIIGISIIIVFEFIRIANNIDN
jgi:hypothetical protein